MERRKEYWGEEAQIIAKCLRKRFYETRGKAQVVADRVNEREGRIVLTPYHCKFCGMYHNGRR